MSDALATTIEDLVAANRILADQGVVDGYGHVSARVPGKTDRYLLSRSLAPASVTAEDIMEYDLDSNPVDQRGRAMYLERFIHGEIYRKRPDVQAVVHNHSPSVIPFGIAPVPMQAVYHMSGFVAAGVPIYEIRDKDGPATDMLIRTNPLGRALADVLGVQPAALMRGHGVVVVAPSVSLVVARSVYLELNARLQMQAMQIAGPGGKVNYLTAEEGQAAVDSNDFLRAWALWREKALANK
ncbi:MAG TPA: class II aldolase/adducin family protein [Burkholderiales bacterium]|jgi:HCOMODA/2-hydroxy-3-carboxy-muconic semialdehyde decarboxylase